MNLTPCRHLRTKQMYIAPSVPPVSSASPADKPFEDESGAPCYFWCNLTMKETGPDDQPVHPEACDGSRSCFLA